MWEGSPRIPALEERNLTRRLITSPFTDSRLPQIPQLCFLSIFYWYFHASLFSELGKCMAPPPHCLAAHDFLLKYCNNLPSSVCLLHYDFNCFNWMVLWHLSSKYCPNIRPLQCFIFIGAVNIALFSSLFLFSPLSCLIFGTKKRKNDRRSHDKNAPISLGKHRCYVLPHPRRWEAPSSNAASSDGPDLVAGDTSDQIRA